MPAGARKKCALRPWSTSMRRPLSGGLFCAAQSVRCRRRRAGGVPSRASPPGFARRSPRPSRLADSHRLEHRSRPQAPRQDPPGNRRCGRAGARTALQTGFPPKNCRRRPTSRPRAGLRRPVARQGAAGLMLSAFEELSSVEIASVLGITESSVRSRLFRARNLMAGLLDHKRSLR